MRVRSKICGITRDADARMAIEFGADALGFNFYQKSKRYVSPAEMVDWANRLPPFVQRIAVLVNAPLLEIEQVAAMSCIDLVQLHGDESPELCQEVAAKQIPFIKALNIGSESDLEKLGRYSTPNILLDASVPGEYGGTGQTMDWDLARKAVNEYPELNIILSGGLTPDNVAEGIAACGPYAVDVASGVESSPGIKDEEKVQRFLANAKS